MVSLQDYSTKVTFTKMTMSQEPFRVSMSIAVHVCITVHLRFPAESFVNRSFHTSICAPVALLRYPGAKTRQSRCFTFQPFRNSPLESSVSLSGFNFFPTIEFFPLPAKGKRSFETGKGRRQQQGKQIFEFI